MEISEIIKWLLDHWYLFFIIVIVYIFSKYSNKEKIGNLSLSNMYFIVEIGFYFIVIYFMQKWFFSEHNYFLLSIPVFIIIWSMAINSILSQNDVYMVETSMMGEPFFDVINGEKIISLSTRLRILIMDKGYYNEKKHIGEIHNPLMQISNRIKFTDLYDDKSGIFYHSVYPSLQNINFYTRIASWLKLKEDLPKIVDENISHTWLEGHKLSVKIQAIEKNYAHQLIGIRKLTDKMPFKLHEDIEDYLELVKSAKKIDTDENTQTENPTVENSESGDGD